MLKFIPQSTARIKLLLLYAQNNKSVGCHRMKDSKTPLTIHVLNNFNLLSLLTLVTMGVC